MLAHGGGRDDSKRQRNADASKEDGVATTGLSPGAFAMRIGVRPHGGFPSLSHDADHPSPRLQRSGYAVVTVLQQGSQGAASPRRDTQ
jgi:hypothetical protein